MTSLVVDSATDVRGGHWFSVSRTNSVLDFGVRTTATGRLSRVVFYRIMSLSRYVTTCIPSAYSGVTSGLVSGLTSGYAGVFPAFDARRQSGLSLPPGLSLGWICCEPMGFWSILPTRALRF
ncbi:hypothetical protein Tco_1423801 [Tanacetum coccineum]